MKSAVATRRMPPVGPTNCGECQSFSNAPWLTDVEIATFAAWADAGAPVGDADAPGVSARPSEGLPRVDRSVAMTEAYTPVGDTDDYRCFVVDPQIRDTSFLNGFSVTPGNPDVVHHVILYGLYSTAEKELADELEAQDDRFGFACFGTSGIDEAPMLAAWAPGTPPIVYPEQTGVRLVPDMKLVMQVHYHLDGEAPEPDLSSMDLMLSETVRDEAVLYPAGNWTFDLEPGQAEVADSATYLDFIGPIGEVQIHAVAPHMHTLGRTMQVEVGQGASRQCLLDVQQWDFDWQGLYVYEEPITVRGGAMARVTCSWDTRAADAPVQWGDGTDDEMCLALFYMTGLP
ncbi:MAG: hypothetical protein AAF211_29475, partial [Myxococcota bacterium]